MFVRHEESLKEILTTEGGTPGWIIMGVKIRMCSIAAEQLMANKDIFVKVVANIQAFSFFKNENSIKFKKCPFT